MTQRFSSLTALLLLTLSASAWAQSPPASRSALPVPRSPAPSGNDLLTQAAARLASEPAISAELRYQVAAYGHELIGTGSYLQLAAGEERLLKLELKTQVGDQPALLQEVRGEDFYWIRRHVPPNPVWLGRVNLRQLRRSAAPALDAPTDVLPQAGWIVLGGLPRLLSSLASNFDFEAPRAEELEHYAADGKTIETSPIWVLAGRWKPDRLKLLTGKDSDQPGDLPDQLPDRVELVLGRTEKLVSLFPYRVTYWRTPKPDKNRARSASPPEPRQVLTLDLFNVSRREIDRSEFLFDAGEQDVLDLTASYIQRAGSETKLR